MITAQLAEQIKVLDGMTRYRFGSDPEVMAGWQAARHLLGVPAQRGRSSRGAHTHAATDDAGR